MPDGSALFSAIVNSAVIRLHNVDNMNVNDAVEGSLKELIGDAGSLDSLLQYIENTSEGSGNSYQILVDRLKDAVEHQATSDEPYLAPENKDEMAADEAITPEKPWYISISQTFLDWEDVKELLHMVDENVPLKSLSSEDEIVSHVSLAMFPTREIAEGVWENLIPSAALTQDDDIIKLSVVDVEFGVIDFRDTPHPLFESANENLNYTGDDYIYMLPISNRSMFTEPESGLWVAVEDDCML